MVLPIWGLGVPRSLGVIIRPYAWSIFLSHNARDRKGRNARTRFQLSIVTVLLFLQGRNKASQAAKL